MLSNANQKYEGGKIVNINKEINERIGMYDVIKANDVKIMTRKRTQPAENP